MKSSNLSKSSKLSSSSLSISHNDNDNDNRILLGKFTGEFDTHLYGGGNKEKELLYNTEIDVNQIEEDEETNFINEHYSSRIKHRLPSTDKLKDEIINNNNITIVTAGTSTITNNNKQDSYLQRRFNAVRHATQINENLLNQIDINNYDNNNNNNNNNNTLTMNNSVSSINNIIPPHLPPSKRRRWDITLTDLDSMEEMSLQQQIQQENEKFQQIAKQQQAMDAEKLITKDEIDTTIDMDTTENIAIKAEERYNNMENNAENNNITSNITIKPKKLSRWDVAAPVALITEAITVSNTDVMKTEINSDKVSIDTTMTTSSSTTSTKKRSRWDDTAGAKVNINTTTTNSNNNSAIPIIPQHILTKLTPEQLQSYRNALDIETRNKPWNDNELDELLPGIAEGFVILQPPEDYRPIINPNRKLMQAIPTRVTDGFFIPDSKPLTSAQQDALAAPIPIETGLPAFNKAEDEKFFAPLLEQIDESLLTSEQIKDRKVLRLLLKVKNGNPAVRKTAMRTITDKAKELGAGPLFDRILPLLMSPTLEDQERHILVKVIDRILYKLDELVGPYVHNILEVIEPLLIDQDFYARQEGREIIANLAKAAGLKKMILTMQPDIDNTDEYVRNTTARALAVVATALGVSNLIPFLNAVCSSKKSWEARHTGIKIVQQIAILQGPAILPHLRQLIIVISKGLEDTESKVRCITALALSACAEAVIPYGIEAFDPVLKPLWLGTKSHRGKTLAAFLKAIGYIIPLMESQYSAYYTKEVMPILIREFSSNDEEMKKIVLKVIRQVIGSEGIEVEYVKITILTKFFENFWIRRMALDKRNYREVVDCTVELANKVGGAEIIRHIVLALKDENESYRRMVMETIEKILSKLGCADIDIRLEQLLIDGMLYAFEEQNTDDSTNNATIMLNSFGTLVNSLGKRCKGEHLAKICGLIKWRLNNKAAKVRQQSADLISKIASTMKECGEEQLLYHLGSVLYDDLGEEYPEVLGSLLNAIKSIVNVVGMNEMTPSVRDLLPRLTPILKNRHEKVQENCIELVGRIADRAAEQISNKEWLRIANELIELLKASRKSIRRAAVSTFGYIAKSIGPADVLATLLNNLKVQDRQSRVCTTVAIAIIAEICSPFTVLPALLNEYTVRELNVQNGVLKSLSFIYEYIGETSRDYVYSIISLLEDALMDRDTVHRQTACTVVKHLALGCIGFNREDAFVHLLNFVWPNIFETSPHVINAVMDAIEALRAVLGPTTLLQYLLQGLFHPARKVRNVYWKIYNSLYIASQDSLVQSYPRLPPDTNNDYRRYELESFL